LPCAGLTGLKWVDVRGRPGPSAFGGRGMPASMLVCILLGVVIVVVILVIPVPVRECVYLLVGVLISIIMIIIIGVLRNSSNTSASERA